MLMIGSNTRIFAGFILSGILLLFAVWAGTTDDAGGMRRLGAVMLIVASIHSMILSCRLMETKEPVVRAGPNSLRVHPAIASSQVLEWADVKQVWVMDLRIPFLPLPFMCWLVIRTRRGAFFDQQSRIIPTSFLGTYFLPVRLLRGGAKSARQFSNLLTNMQRADKGAASGKLQETEFDRDLRWSILENTELPMGKDGPDEDTMVAATQSAMLRKVGIHEDLMSEEMVAELKQQPGIKEINDKAEGWARQSLAEERADDEANEPADLSGTKPPVFGRKKPGQAMLNGKPLDDQ